MVQVYGAELNILGKHWGFATSCLDLFGKSSIFAGGLMYGKPGPWCRSARFMSGRLAA